MSASAPAALRLGSLARALRLGASLYAPATRPDLPALINGKKLPGLRSMIVCTEDAVLASDLGGALLGLERALAELEPSETLRFVRPRDPETLRQIASMRGVDRLDGFVLPKVTNRNLLDYFGALPPNAHVMLTLETVDAFDAAEMRRLAQTLSLPRYAPRVLSLRIGGNDLLGALALRRPRGRTSYDTPLGHTISSLVTIFRPIGLNLTAPVFDGVDEDEVLEREVALDLAHGLFGKTAIHPSQIAKIEAMYRVSREELTVAERVLAESTPAVSLIDERMCEPSTQARWAELTLGRARLYGVKD